MMAALDDVDGVDLQVAQVRHCCRRGLRTGAEEFGGVQALGMQPDSARLGGGIITPPVEAVMVVPQVSWSPDGRRLAYCAYPATGDGINVVLINADGTGRRQLSTPGRSAVLPAWLPAAQ